MSFVPPDLDGVPTIDEMVRRMDQTVAGLKEFKERLAVVLRDHMVSAVLGRDWRPQNVLIVGPTGGGKTYTLRRLLDSIPVIWAEVAMTEFSDVGYHGRDLTSCYLGLTHNRWREVTGANVKGRPVYIDLAEHRRRAERFGVMLLDEFDKIRTNKVNVPGERQVGRVLQFELLKLVEGTECDVQENPDRQGFLFRTHHVLHIAMGAFEGINDVISSFDKIGWSERLYERMTTEDLIEYGFIQELAGRFATILTLPPLKQDHLIRIMREQLVPMLSAQLADEGLELVIDEGGLMTVANLVLQHKAIGARGLEPELHAILWRARRQARPGDRIVVDAPAAAQQVARVERRAVA
jgi:ATP-dependent protease Clp ATPase subunit